MRYAQCCNRSCGMPPSPSTARRSGRRGTHGVQSGKVKELDYATQQVLFEATLLAPMTFFTTTMHRTERLTLYP